MMYNIYDEESNYITSLSLAGVVKGDYVFIEELNKELCIKKITHVNETLCRLVVGQPSKK